MVTIIEYPFFIAFTLTPHATCWQAESLSLDGRQNIRRLKIDKLYL